jgi:hypothetical protein
VYRYNGLLYSIKEVVMSDGTRGVDVEAFLAERAAEVYSGLGDVALSGRQPSSSKPPYGYRVVRKHDVLTGRRPYSQLGKYVVIDEEASFVQRAFDEYLRTGSCVEVARFLTNIGAPTREGKAKWSFGTVLFMLKNRAYVGEAVWGGKGSLTRSRKGGETSNANATPLPTSPLDKAQGGGAVHATSTARSSAGCGDGAVMIPCPGIVDAVVFEAVQVCLRSTAARLKPRATGVVNLLDGVIYCGDCGSRMSDGFYKPSKSRRGGGYYACRQCEPSWNANSPRPQWSAYPHHLVEKEVRRQMEAFLPTEDGAFALEYLFSPGWDVPTWRRRQILLLSRPVVRVYNAPFRVEMKVGGDEAGPEVEKLLVAIVEETARMGGNSDVYVQMMEWGEKDRKARELNSGDG